MLEQAAPLAFVAQRVAIARGYDTRKPYDAAWEGLDHEKPGLRKRPSQLRQTDGSLNRERSSAIAMKR